MVRLQKRALFVVRVRVRECVVREWEGLPTTGGGGGGGGGVVVFSREPLCLQCSFRI